MAGSARAPSGGDPHFPQTRSDPHFPKHEELPRPVSTEKIRFVKPFLVEIAVYAVLVTVYFFLCLHFLGDWLKGLFDGDRRIYACVALGLMLGQGVLLEVTTTWLLRFIRARTK